MKRFSIVVVCLLLFTASIAQAQQNPCAKKKAQNPCNPCAKKAQNPCNPCAGKMAKVKGGKRTLVGYIGDSQCGLNHPMNMGDGAACTLKCVDGGGKFIVADRKNKVVYNVDDESQEKVRAFAGKKVKVTGNVDAESKTIRITKIVSA
jgi:uncharacterized protein YdeI (BOF family)